MNENKFSREECKGCEFWAVNTERGRCSDSNMDTDDNDCCRAWKPRIKSLLTPIPEDKLDEFVERQLLKFPPIRCNRQGKEYLKEILKEYNELKEGG